MEDSKQELIQILDELIVRYEYELVEFKEANNDFDKDKIGKYFSAISNEANLKDRQYGWLIFGIRDKDKKIVGSDYRDTNGLDKLKQEISNNTTGRITFIDIFEVYPEIGQEKKRVIMFKIPAAVTSIPTGWNNQYFGRNGESLVPLTLEELDRIRTQKALDWSKQVIEVANLEHLDKEAIGLARAHYKVKNNNKEHIVAEVDNMRDLEFLTKIKLVLDNKITNAGMVLLGNSDYDYLLETPPKIMWRLYDQKGNDKDYEIFTIPFIKVVDKVYDKIRNLTYRYMPNQLSLFTEETEQYDPSLVRELIYNCIAHQDYTIGGRIYVNEFEDDKIRVTNPGSFLPKSIEVVLMPSYSPPYYRNQILAEAMSKLNMIDTASMGIRKIFNIQKQKYFPLPDYDFNDPNIVAVTVYGKIINENYTRLLYNNQELELDTIFLLDKVQKSIALSKVDAEKLRKLRLIEGKYPNLFVSSSVAKIVNEKAQYIKNKGFEDEYYRKMIVAYLNNFGSGKKKDFLLLLLNKLPDILSEKQKEDKIKNLLQKLKTDGVIDLDGTNQRLSNWVIKK
ncbi:MAG: RNA-binding domain-containing protein [Bacteroidota bacterium]